MGTVSSDSVPPGRPDGTRPVPSAGEGRKRQRGEAPSGRGRDGRPGSGQTKKGSTCGRRRTSTWWVFKSTLPLEVGHPGTILDDPWQEI